MKQFTINVSIPDGKEEITECSLECVREEIKSRGVIFLRVQSNSGYELEFDELSKVAESIREKLNSEVLFVPNNIEKVEYEDRENSLKILKDLEHLLTSE